MKVWTLGLLLVAAVLAEKAVARPEGEADYQEDEHIDEDSELPLSPAAVPAPVLKTIPLTFTPRPGDTVELPCVAENAETFIWLNGSATLFIGTRRLTYKDDQRVSQLDNNSLVIRDVRPTDSNKYTCKVAANLDVVHHINVYEPPRIKFTDPPERSLTLQNGQHVTLRCNATGFPEPVVTWTRKGRNLPVTGKKSHQGDHIHFRDVNVQHSGTYVCSATNELGTEERRFDLLVSDLPSIDAERNVVNTNIGENVEVVCIVYAHPPAEVTWHFNSEELKPGPHIQMGVDPEHGVGRRHTLTIQGVSEDNLGPYYCTAMNEKGSSRRSIRVVGTPTPAKLANVTYDQGRPVLYWSVESSAPINKYELMYRRIEPVSDWTVVEPAVRETKGHIYNVHYELKEFEDAEYEAKLKSHNKFGWSDLSDKYPFRAGPLKRAESSRVKDAAGAAEATEAGNSAPVNRICSVFLLGCIAVILLRS